MGKHRYQTHTSPNGCFFVIKRKQWLAEAAIWLENWQTQGDIFAATAVSLLALESHEFGDIIMKFPHLHFDVCLYAGEFARLQTITDLTMLPPTSVSEPGSTPPPTAELTRTG